MTTIACTQPGCTGSILDGYCDVCGSPAAASGAACGRSGPGPDAAPAIGASAGGCTQPGCTGTIVDGYCDVCGSPAAAGAAAEPSAPRPWRSACPAGVGETPSTASRASNRLASTALGSARAAAGGSKITRRVGTSSTRLRGARLGAGLTSIPPVPAVDAGLAIMKNPMVPEERRDCPTCGAPVGRSRDGQPGRTEGFCPKCRTPYSFTPKLKAGDLVGGQYEVAGALAHGGLGLDLRRARPQRVRPLGRAQGPAELRRPGRPRRSDRRAPVPGPGRAPAHRRDLQLRRPTRVPATSSWSTSAARRSSSSSRSGCRRPAAATTRSRSTRRSPS